MITTKTTDPLCFNSRICTNNRCFQDDALKFEDVVMLLDYLRRILMQGLFFVEQTVTDAAEYQIFKQP